MRIMRVEDRFNRRTQHHNVATDCILINGSSVIRELERCRE